MSLFPPFYLDAVVSLGPLQTGAFQHIGTGFIYAHPYKELEGTTKYTAVLVTSVSQKTPLADVDSGATGERATFIHYKSNRNGSG